MQISVIVPTSGRSAALARTLPTLLEQTIDPRAYELLVVENGTESGARRVTRRASRRQPDRALRYLHEPTPGLLSGRHRGALEARGEILVFADDDIDASPDWLEAIVTTFRDPAAQLVGGRNLPRYETPPPAWLQDFWYTPPYGGRACVYLSLLDLGDQPLAIDANYVWGLNFSIRRSTLFELGGFHPDSYPGSLRHLQGDGETGLTMKANQAGLLTIYQPRALIHHRVPRQRLNVEYIEQRKSFQGVCDSFTSIRQNPELFVAPAGETSAEPLPQPPPPANSRVSARRRWPPALRWLRSSPSPSPAEEAPADLHARIQAAYSAGFDFHQNAVRSRPGLLDWVKRNDYWDFRLPDLASRP